MKMKRIETVLWLSAGGLVYLFGAGAVGIDMNNGPTHWVGPLWRPAWAVFVALSVTMGWGIEALQQDAARIKEARTSTMAVTPEERAVIESMRKDAGT